LFNWPFSYDFYYLWSAGNLCRLGLDPFDKSLLTEQLLAIGWPAGEGIQAITHFPYVFWLYYLFSFLPFEIAQFVWVGFTTFGYLAIFKLILRLVSKLQNNKSVRLRGSFIFVIALFPPGWIDIIYGQINWIILLALLLSVSELKNLRSLKAGLLLSLTACKPHLLLPVYAALFTSELRQRKLMLVIGFFVGLVFQAALVATLAPQIYSQYFAHFSSTMSEARLLVGASLSQILTNISGSPLMSAILAISGILIGIIWGMRNKEINRSFFSFLLPISLVGAPYVWTHSLVLLLPAYALAVFHLINKSEKFTLLFCSLISALAFGTIFRADLAKYWALLPLICLFLGFCCAKTFKKVPRSVTLERVFRRE